MYDALKNLVLKILKVPPEPDDPMGDVKSLRVFRASYNYYRYQFIIWMIKSFSSIAGTFIAAAFIFGFLMSIQKKIPVSPGIFFIALLLIAAAMLLFSFFHIFISYIIMRLNYEMRWYKVSDRSLRIREGVSTVREITMTFANIQNIYVLQGPVQRFFKIADLKVESAGGGGTIAQSKEQADSLNLHVAYFRGIDNAEEIRDLMRERIKVYQDSGLGDMQHARHPSHEEKYLPGDETETMKEIRDECARFRASLQNFSAACK